MHSPRVTALHPPRYSARMPRPPSQGTSLCQDRFQERAISWPSTLPPPNRSASWIQASVLFGPPVYLVDSLWRASPDIAALVWPGEYVPPRGPFGVQILTHVQHARHGVTGQLSGKTIGERGAVHFAHVAGNYYVIAGDGAGAIARDECPLVGTRDLVVLLFDVQNFVRPASRELDADAPAAGEVARRRFRRFRLPLRSGRGEYGVDPVADDLVFSRRHHVGGDGDSRFVARAAASSASAAPAAEDDARLGGVQDMSYFLPRDAQLGGVPTDRQTRAVVGQPPRLAHGRRDAIDFGDPICNVVHPGGPHRDFGLVIALHPHLDRHEHADGLLLAQLHGAAMAMMRRAGDPGGLDEILAAQQDSGALRPADALAAAVAHQRGAPLEVDVGNRQHLSGGVHQHGDVLFLGDAVNGVVRQRSGFGSGPGEHVDHRDLDRKSTRL